MINSKTKLLVKIYFSSPQFLQNWVRSISHGRGLLGRLVDKLRYKYNPSDVPTIPTDFTNPGYEKRVLIGPDNTSGQAYYWARALEQTSDDTSVVSVNGTDDSLYKALVDIEVKPAVFITSNKWHEDFDRFLETRTHILYESCFPLLGRKFSSIKEEINYFRNRDQNIAFLFHGSDIRLPSKNMELNSWSPFNRMPGQKRILEETVKRNMDIIAWSKGRSGVSTPDLLDYLPSALWVPLTISVGAETPQILSDLNTHPLVVHPSTNSALKGTDLIEPQILEFVEKGLIKYKRVQGLSPQEALVQISESDIVLEQFVINGYGVAACEGMARGKIVVGNVSDTTRERIRDITGFNLPIVQATPDTLSDVLFEIVRNLDEYKEEAVKGYYYVKEVHDGRFAGKQLRKLIS